MSKYRRPEYRKRLSEINRKKVKKRWDAYHADQEPTPEPWEDFCELTVKNLITGKVTQMSFHRGTRKNNMLVKIDGHDWKTCGVVAAANNIAESIFGIGR